MMHDQSDGESAELNIVDQFLGTFVAANDRLKASSKTTCVMKVR
jgi:dimeric dUTPase (all-alpha-NTP-PPase superfamily)